MGEEAYDETRFVTDNGTVIIRGGYGRENVWLGLSSKRNEEDDPDVVVRLGPGLQKRVVEAIQSTTFVALEDANERLDIAREALEKLASGGMFEDEDKALAWVRGIAESALEEIGS
jgi:hypothetical protein